MKIFEFATKRTLDMSSASEESPSSASEASEDSQASLEVESAFVEAIEMTTPDKGITKKKRYHI